MCQIFANRAKSGHPRSVGYYRSISGICSLTIWLLDVAHHLPVTAHLDGFDISLDQGPPSAWIPKNIKLHIWNIFDDPPEEYVQAFDFLHVRLITVVFRNNDPQPVLASLRKLISVALHKNLAFDMTNES